MRKKIKELSEKKNNQKQKEKYIQISDGRAEEQH